MSLLQSPTAIVRKIVSMSVPEEEGTDGSAFQKDDRKQVAELPTCLHHSRLLQTDVKFLVDFQETPSGTRSLESVVNDTIHRPEVFPRCWAFYNVK